MKSKTKSDFTWKTALIYALLIPYLIYIIPCFIRAFFPNLCCLNKPIKIVENKPTPTPIPTPIKTPKPKICIDKEEIETITVEKQVEIEKTLPCPEINPETKIQTEIIHHPPEIPEELINDWNKVQNYDIEKIKKQKESIKQQITELQNSIPTTEFSVDTNAEEPKDIDFDEASVRQQIQQEIQKHIVDGDEIPLILTSIKGKTFTQATTKFDQLIKSNTESRYSHAIPQDNNKRWCSPESPSNFSFWTPYPIWVQSFNIEFPNRKSLNDYANTISIDLLLEGDSVYSSPKPYKVDQDKITISLNNPVRFNRVRVVANGKGSVCIGDIHAYTSKKIV